MYKFMSWLIIAFIGLVPLGAFFDTKKPPKPNMEQFFMKREKRATNSSQCGNSCELEFARIKQSAFIYNPYFQNNFNSNLLQVKIEGLNIPYDIPRNVGGGYFPNPSLILLVKEKSNVYDKINNFYRNNATYSSNAYVVDSLVNAKL
ncbi:hypothetical protein [Spiroplasma endosymbiont of Tipula paludosa]|uniref:hypothetical protein n=1 Tax=Spiroplasma endosymbiont of Tipula paludosa TaxID=3066295 RepID=UPI0035C89892